VINPIKKLVGVFLTPPLKLLMQSLQISWPKILRLHDVSKFESSVFATKLIGELLDQLHQQGSRGGLVM